MLIVPEGVPIMAGEARQQVSGAEKWKITSSVTNTKQREKTTRGAKL